MARRQRAHSWEEARWGASRRSKAHADAEEEALGMSERAIGGWAVRRSASFGMLAQCSTAAGGIRTARRPCRNKRGINT